MAKKSFAAIATSAFLAATISAPVGFADERGHLNPGNDIQHVLLISIDGMHAVDFLNCSKGVSPGNGGDPYCPHLVELAETGVNYLETSASKPSDSFPGLTAIVSGGSARTEGVFYDVAYDRSLNPPAVTTGNGVLAGPCTPGPTPIGTRTEYEEGIDYDQSFLNGIGSTSQDGGKASIDPNKLPRDKNCHPVYPWNFVRTNTIFGVIHAAGGYTAWSDKHPSYLSVSGPGDGSNVDDYYSPEVNSKVVALPGVKTPEPRMVEVRKNILKQNDVIAAALRERFRTQGIRAVSLVSSPGSGKTAFLEETLKLLRPHYRVAALVGDLATENDAARLARSGAPVKQITTGTLCHLEASMIQKALDGWDVGKLDFLFIEDVGNLVCPSWPCLSLLRQPCVGARRSVRTFRDDGRTTVIN
jgi:hypothetical protein